MSALRPKSAILTLLGAQIWGLVTLLLVIYCNNVRDTSDNIVYDDKNLSKCFFVLFLRNCVRLEAKISYFDPFGGPNMGVSELTTDDIL